MHDDVESGDSVTSDGRPVDDAVARDGLVVVGIGASAGGLDALVELIQHVPREGMAYVVVQHLAPDHESLLPQLLAFYFTFD